VTPQVMQPKWVSNTAKTIRALAESHDRYLEFCPAKSQLYRGVVKCRKADEQKNYDHPAVGGPLGRRTPTG
jgi:hypothetical protein